VDQWIAVDAPGGWLEQGRGLVT